MATATRRYLVTANQTLAEAELTEAIRERQQAGPSSFHVVVPNRPRGPRRPYLQRRTGRSRCRRRHRRPAAEVEGDIGDADPLKAVTDVLDGRQFDEIILSTLPQRVSKWLAMDLPHRLHRHSGLPVTTITTQRVV